MEQNPSLFDLEIDHPTGEEMLDTSRWQRMLGVLLVICIGLVLLMLLLGWSQVVGLVDEAFGGGSSQGVMAFVVVVLLLVAIIVGVMAGLLIRGASRIKTAIRTKEQDVFNDGLADLKSFFIIYGVISILSLLANLVTFF